jgi:hypothetical protein
MGATFAGKTVQDAHLVFATCRRLGFPTDWASLANRYENPLGVKSGVGHILMLRQDLDALNSAGQLNAENDLVLYDSTNGRTFKSLHVVSTTCITPGYPNDPAAVHLCELADHRRLMWQLWQPAESTSGQNKFAYNVRQHAAGPYNPLTVYNYVGLTQTPFTWDQILADIWTRLTTPTIHARYASPAPTLPTPTLIPALYGTPDGFDFRHVPVMAALGYFLNRVGAALKWDCFLDQFGIVKVGDTQPNLAADEQGQINARLFDIEPLNLWYGTVPEKVYVYFRKQGARENEFGDDPFVSYPVNAVDVGVSSQQITIGGVEALFDDLPATMEYHAAGDRLRNGADLSDRATVRATDYYRIRQNFQGSAYQKTYSGFLDKFLPGEQVSSVAWQDLTDGSPRANPLTIVDRTPYEPDRFADWPGGQGREGETSRPWDQGPLRHPFRPIHLAGPSGFITPPATGYEDYVLRQCPDGIGGANMSWAADDIGGEMLVWRLTVAGQPIEPLHEMAQVVGYDAGRPVIVTVSDSAPKGSGGFGGATISTLGGSTATDFLSTDQTGMHLVVGYAAVSSTFNTTVQVTFANGSEGTIATLPSFTTVSGFVQANTTLYLPVVQLVNVVGMTHGVCKMSVTISVPPAGGGPANVASGVLAWTRL